MRNTASSGHDRPWSYSLLSAWELCPKKTNAESIAKVVKQKQHEANNYGTHVHECMDRRVKGTPLPLDLKHHEPVIAKFMQHGENKVGEQKIALTENLQPTGFFDRDVWVRAVIDFMAWDDRSALMVDWKTGRMKSSFDQLDLMAVITFALLPELQKLVGVFYWMKEKKPTRKIYTRDDIPVVWEEFLPRVEAMQDGIRAGRFPAKPNFLCQKYCPVKTCEHNGVRHG